ncbi:MAG: PAS domain-containing sensor histidine kinase [Candidatus Thorarchaeota archaeon]
MNLERDALRKVAETMHLPVVEFDLDYNFLYANKAALDLLEMGPSVLDSNLIVDDLLASDNVSLVHSGFQALIDGVTPTPVSVRAIRSDKVQVPIEAFGNLVYSKGEVCGFVVYVLDMTRRSRIEEKLKEREEFFHLVIEHSHAGILVIDNKFMFEYANDRLCDMIGRTRSELIGHDFRNFVHPDSVAIVGDRYLKRQRGEDVPSVYEFQVLHKDGTVIDAQVTSATMKDHDGTIKTVAQLVDITISQQSKALLEASEHRYRSLIETMADGLVIDDINGKLVYANETLTRMMGYDSPEELIGLQDGDILNGFSNDVIEEKHAARREGATERYETYLKHRSGRLIPVMVSASPYFDMSGAYSGTFAILTDISELRTAEAESRFLLDLLMHDVGNQLQLILAGSDLCNTESSIEVIEGAQSYVREGANRCLDLITKIRRAEEAKDQPLQPIDIVEVLKAESNLLTRLYDVKVEMKGIPKSVMINADGALSQMLWNLMENAVKHNPGPERMVWIGGKMEDDTFHLSISDNGPGLGRSERTQIFEEIRRFGGVGLHIVRRLISKYHAKLTADERIQGYPSEGLKVTVVFKVLK